MEIANKAGMTGEEIVPSSQEHITTHVQQTVEEIAPQMEKSPPSVAKKNTKENNAKKSVEVGKRPAATKATKKQEAPKVQKSNKRKAQQKDQAAETRPKKPKSVSDTGNPVVGGETTKIRASPSILSSVVESLSSSQREWVERTGLGVFLEFKIDALSHRMGFRVVTALSPARMMLVLNSGTITNNSVCKLL